MAPILILFTSISRQFLGLLQIPSFKWIYICFLKTEIFNWTDPFLNRVLWEWSRNVVGILLSFTNYLADVVIDIFVLF